METVERWTTRSDAWTPEDDNKLAEIVLRHIREGSTQLNAFVEAANLLGRTPAACGYRWNGVVRRNYSDEIKQAKQEKKSLSTLKGHFARRRTWSPDLEDTSIDGIIRALKQHERLYYELLDRNRELQEQIHSLQQEVEQLQAENRQLRDREMSSGSAADLLSEDSKTLLKIMERARKLLEAEEK
ncbi:RsfA family transcriptional regulator [Effusibacillus pohliae]|uniref:RsfA family transcriptional regulator n=1 Tax=Effusibacillus pohliae TaxID=232270 RepID=UPI00036B3FE5|nr:RsfA family transcriptional regulator [Effusibacillus pohliae]